MNNLAPTQKCLLNIYKKFSQFCDKHNLRYFAAAGTAIGAIRHHGFIPWDDDIDLVMPLEDFNRLKKLVKKGLPKNLAFRESYWMGGKIHDISTTVIDVRFLNDPNNYHGVYIDIFPLIGLPNNEPARQKFIEDINSFKVNAELLEFYPEVSPYSKKQILEWKKYLQSAYSFKDSKKLAAFSYFMCDGDGVRNPIKVPFEDTTIPISSNYDWDLRNHFGDYMTLPPKAEQQNHDKYHYIDLTHPYSQYVKDYKDTPQWLLQIINQNHLIEGELTQFSNSLQYILNSKESENTHLHSQIDAKQQEINDIFNSITYKTGDKFLKPLKTIKRILHHEK